MLPRGVMEYLRLRPRTRSSIEEQVDEEIALHLELRVQELVNQGLSSEEARAEAERRFGAVADARRRLHERAQQRERRVSIREWLGGWRQDLAYSTRALAREPLAAGAIVVTLGLGLGATATMFGIVDQLLVRGPSHIEEPERVLRLHLRVPSLQGGESFVGTRTGYNTKTILREGTDVFDDVAAYHYRTETRFGRGEAVQIVSAGWATANLFPLLGVQPALGRFFTEREDRPFQAERVAVLDWSWWQSRFGGDVDVLGSTIVMQDEEFTIIGVAPPGFSGPQLQHAQLWLPFSAGDMPTDDWPTTWNATWTHILVRLGAGVARQRAEAAATAALRAAGAAAGLTNTAQWEVLLRPPVYSDGGAEAPEFAVSRWLAAVSLIVLLVAGANVVNLLIARGLRRRRELAVRMALGVSQARLARLLVSESLILAVAGGTLAIAIAVTVGQFLRLTLLPDIAWDAPLNARVLAFTATAVVLTAVIVGLAPALQALRHDVIEALRSTGGDAAARPGRLRGGLTVLQTALAVVLLIGAGHFVRSLWNVRGLDLGIRHEGVLAISPMFPSLAGMPEAERDAERERRRALGAVILERLRARSDIAAVSRATAAPLRSTISTTMRVAGHDTLPMLPGGGPYVIGVDGGYFETVGTRTLRGRPIQDTDVRRGEHVAVVNETMARTLWPDAEPLGHCLHVGGGADAPCFRVIGVAEDTRRFRFVEEAAMQYYIPIGLGGQSGGSVIVRAAGKPNALVGELRGMVHALDPAMSYVDVTPLGTILDPQMRPWRLGSTMFLVFGALALVIAAIGLYSVIACSVTRRSAELSVRMALGARAGSITAMIVRQGLGLVLLGIALGVPAALLVGRRIEPLLFETSATHAGTFLFVAAVLLVVAVVATALPAARAGRTDPMDALRTN
jgi:predicted permease